MMRWFKLLLLTGGTLFLFAIPLRTPLNIYDEGLALVGGLRVYNGEIPFGDYWAIYPPAQSYALAAVFRVAGISVLAERVYDSLVRLALVVVVYFVSSSLVTVSQGMPRGKWIPTVSIAMILAAATFYGYAMFPALLFAFLALMLFFLAVQRAQNIWLLAAGLSIGVTALFRIDTAVYVSGGIFVALLLTTLHTQMPEGSWRQDIWDKSWRLAAAALLLIVPIYGWLAWNGNAGQMFNNLLVFPATTFHDVRHLPYPSLSLDWSRWQQRNIWLAQIDWTVGEWLRFYLPIFSYLLSALLILMTLAVRLWQKRSMPQRHIYASAILVLGVGLFIQAMSRYDGIHALPTSLPTVLLLGWLWSELVVQRWWRPVFAYFPGILSLPALVVYGILPLLMWASLAYRFPPITCYSTIPRASCAPVSQDATKVIEALQDRSKENQSVFVASATHDRIFVNDVSLYFLAERPIPTRYHELHPGVVTTLPVQQEIINELQTNEVKWLFVVDWPNPNEPNDSAKSSGITNLDEYIRSNYRAIEQFGIYQLWEKK